MTGESDVPKELEEKSISEIRDKIRQKIGILYSLGYGHGDLHIGNIGITYGGEIVLYDFDTGYNIEKDRDSEWLNTFIIEGYGEDMTYDDFVEHDWKNWQTDWMSD
jgi:RIO-like serine/threonine protein kinase